MDSTRPPAEIGLIQNTFLKAFETGLRDDILATNLRRVLRKKDISDEELMRQVDELASNQAETKTARKPP